MNVFTGEMSAEQTRMNELYTTLKAWSDAYYNDDAPLATDEEYDRLMRELKQLEAEHPYWVAEDSPTQNVGGKRVMGIPVEHRVPMLSLEDVFERGSVRDFVDAVQKEYPETTFSVERKIDGLSLSLVYEDGKLVQASTRGDGRVGEDVTANVMALPSVPKKFELPRGGENNEPLFHHIELRGECYMGEEDFLAANAEQRVAGKKPYMNPRNCAAGTLRQSDPAIAKKRNLQVFIFNVQEVDGNIGNHCAQMALMETRGFKTACVFHALNADEAINAIDGIGYSRHTLAYPIDGAVVKVNELDIREKMGERTKTPKWAIAYKYPAEEKATILRRILLQTGRTGRVTPVAEFDNIMLAGTNVTRATLNNQDFINKMDIRIGDTITVRKSGDIIPQITSAGRTGLRPISSTIARRVALPWNRATGLLTCSARIRTALHRQSTALSSLPRVPAWTSRDWAKPSSLISSKSSSSKLPPTCIFCIRTRWNWLRSTAKRRFAKFWMPLRSRKNARLTAC